jgi:hypothetical protein
VHLEASTKPHFQQKFAIFWTNIASTMVCPNFKNGPKYGLGHLGVKKHNIYKDSTKNQGFIEYQVDTWLKYESTNIW